MTLETLITFLIIENNNMDNYIVTSELRVMVTAFAILAMFVCICVSVYLRACVFFVFSWLYMCVFVYVCIRVLTVTSQSCGSKKLDQVLVPDFLKSFIWNNISLPRQ